MADKDSRSPASVPSKSKRSNGRVKRPIDQMQHLLKPPDYLFGNTNLPPLNNRISQHHNAETEHQKTEDQEDEMLLPLKKRLSRRLAIRPQVNNNNLEVDVIRPQVVNLEEKEAQVEVIRSKIENLEVGQLMRGLDDPEILLTNSGLNRRMTRSLIRSSGDSDRGGGVRLTRSQTQTRMTKEQVRNDNGREGLSSIGKRKPVNQGGRRVCVECGSDLGKMMIPRWLNGPEGHGTLCKACGKRQAKEQNNWGRSNNR